MPNWRRLPKAFGMLIISTYFALMYVITKEVSIAPYDHAPTKVLFHRFMFSLDLNVMHKNSLTHVNAESSELHAQTLSLFRYVVIHKYGLLANLSNYTYENLKSAGGKRTFCYEQLVEVYGHPKQQSCNSARDTYTQIFCQKSFNSLMMDFCTADNVVFKDASMFRLNTTNAYCKPLRWPTFKDVKTKYMKSFVQNALTYDPISFKCRERINIGYFYVINNNHIYFKVLGYYSVFETLLRNDHKVSDVRFYRTEEFQSWPNKFSDFEQNLFGKVETFSDAEGACFNKVFLVPDGYSTNPFRCKMSGESMVFQCRNCNGSKMPLHAVHLFKHYILSKCGVSGSRSHPSDIINITLVLRKPYQRFSHDRSEHFSRVLLNSRQVVDLLKRNLSSAVVNPCYMETLSFCDQVRLAWSSDMLIGVHGAALVHLWWLDEYSEAIEIEPHDQRGNPTFRTLSRLTNTRYSRYMIDEYMDTHVALGKDFIEFVQSRIASIRKAWRQRTLYNGIQKEYEGTLPEDSEVILDDGDLSS